MNNKTRDGINAQDFEIGPHRQKLFPVLTGSDQKQSGGLALPEYVGPELVARNLLVGDSLDSGPPLGLEQGLARQPIRNGLLTDSGAIHEFGDAIRQRGLASGNDNRSFQRGNVFFIDFRHKQGLYTRMLVHVNEHACFTSHKDACTVLYMKSAKHKLVPAETQRPKKPRKPRAPEQPGPEGTFFRERLEIAMQEKRPGYTAKDLERDCNIISGRPPDAEKAFVSQQLISQMRKGKNLSSKYSTVMAEALNVRGPWLQFGFLPKRGDREVLGAIKNIIVEHSGDISHEKIGGK